MCVTACVFWTIKRQPTENKELSAKKSTFETQSQGRLNTTHFNVWDYLRKVSGKTQEGVSVLRKGAQKMEKIEDICFLALDPMRPP